MEKTVLLAFDDPGGGLAVSSLIERLRGINHLKLKICSGHLSENFVNYLDFKKLKSHLTRPEAEKIISESSPDVLITGTSGGTAEQELRNAAYEKKIKSIVILDFWKDYRRRWLYASYELEDMNDKICVMDELTKQEMIEDGFPEAKLVVTGHPYLDKIFNYERSGKIKNKTEVNSFLFLSQPLHIIGIKDYQIHPFETLLRALQDLSEAKNKKILLIVKLHPTEVLSSELSSLADLYNSEKLSIEIADIKDDLKDLITRSEIVVGYNTIAMFETRSMNKRTISLNVVPVKKSLISAMQTAGIEIVESSGENIFNCLKNGNNNVLSPHIFKGGIENCIRLISNELNLN